MMAQLFSSFILTNQQTLFFQTVRKGEPSLYNNHTLPNPRTAVSAATQSTPTIEDGRPRRPASSADVRHRVKSGGRDVDKGDEGEEETTCEFDIFIFINLLHFLT